MKHDAGELSNLEKEVMKKVLITGADSYIGMSFEKWMAEPRFKGQYQVDTVDMKKESWKRKDFSGYDAVFHVAGIAHADIGKATQEQRKLYYRVNCELAVETAIKAKKEKVGQFIYMSSIIVYGENKFLQNRRVITRETVPKPSNFYGDSKWRAERKLNQLSDQEFSVAILRPPMIYGKGSKGNYPLLSNLARKLPVFPDYENKRSVLYIGNLCEFVRCLVEAGTGGIFFPQNSEYVRTADLVKIIAESHDKKIYLIRGINWLIYLTGKLPGKMGGMANKAFGTLIYEKEMQPALPFNIWDLRHSIIETEKEN